METQRKLNEILTEYVNRLRAHDLPFKSLLIGPKEYILLKYEMTGATITDEMGHAELLQFMGIPVRIKSTQGVELEIDPVDVGRYIGSSGQSKTTELSPGESVRDVGEGETKGNP